jgi:hypothetical protein
VTALRVSTLAVPRAHLVIHDAPFRVAATTPYFLPFANGPPTVA